jgi:4-amino-4-deoxy-L-arabinose transferase-like glycosyltransferase
MMQLSPGRRVRDGVQQIIECHPWVVLCLVGGMVSFAGLCHELWTPDEPRDAAIGRGMWTSGGWITPRLNGEPFLEKPPFYWWVQAALFAAVDGATPALARLPSALFGFFTLFLTYALGRQFFSPAISLIGALVLLSTSLFTLTTHWVVVDNALVFAIAGAWLFFTCGENRNGWVRNGWFLGMYAFLGLAFLSKGVVGVAIPALGIAVYLAWSGRLGRFIGWHMLAGAGLVAGSAGVWLYFVWREEGIAGLQTFLVYNQLGRFFPHEEYKGGHVRPFWYYFANAPADFLPWTPFLALAAVTAWRHWYRISEAQRDGLRFCVAGTLPVLLVLSLAGTKRSLYLLPIFPLLGLFVGWWAAFEGERKKWELKLEYGWERILLAAVALSPAVIFLDRSRWPYWLAAAVVLVFTGYLLKAPGRQRRQERILGTAILVSLAAAILWITTEPYLDRHKSFLPFVADLEKYVPQHEPLYAFQPDETMLGIIGFYSGRDVTVVDFEGLQRLAGQSGPSWLVVRDTGRRGGNYDAIVGFGVPHRLVSATVIGRDRRLRILALGGKTNS